MPLAISRARKFNHKYDIELPSMVNDAYEIDKNNSNKLWRDTIKKEIHTIGIAFEILEEDEFVPKDYKSVTCHMIFDAKNRLCEEG